MKDEVGDKAGELNKQINGQSYPHKAYNSKYGLGLGRGVFSGLKIFFLAVPIVLSIFLLIASRFSKVTTNQKINAKLDSIKADLETKVDPAEAQVAAEDQAAAPAAAESHRTRERVDSLELYFNAPGAAAEAAAVA